MKNSINVASARLWILLITLSASAIISLVLSPQQHGGLLTPNTANQAVSQQWQDLDFIITNFQLSSFSETGELNHKLTAEKLEQGTEGPIQLTQPIIKWQDHLNPPWTATANSGQISRQEHLIVLVNNVILAQHTDPELTIEGPHMQFSTDTGIAKTPERVHIRRATGQLSGTGFTANLKQKTLHLAQQVKGAYELLR